MSPEVLVRVPAKINLALRVGPLRPDGYHDLATVFHAVALFDEVSAREGSAGGGVQLQMQGRHTQGVPTDGSNLAARAAQLIAAEIGVAPDVHLRLNKGIPVAGGMAGGSADAAGALLACDALWHAGLSRERLHELAAQLGSDVPFALLGGTALGAGRGERLTPVLARGEYHWVVVTSPYGLSTPRVYAELDALRAAAGDSGQAGESGQLPVGLMQALRAGDPVALAASVANDLQAAAISLQPDLARLLEEGTRAGALAGLVSGSGPSVVFLARDGDDALDLAVRLAALGLPGEVLRASGPVPGARLIDPSHPSHPSA